MDLSPDAHRAGLGSASLHPRICVSPTSPPDDECFDDTDNPASNDGPFKRRRLSKPIDRRFVCPYEGCSKKYGRSEHLSRHQLNHIPKHVYRCEQPGCDRRFVRQDLLTRHLTRHASRDTGQVRTTKNRYDLPVTYRAELGVVLELPSPGSRRDSTLAPQSNAAVKSELETLPGAVQSYAQGSTTPRMPPPMEARSESDKALYGRPLRSAVNEGMANSSVPHLDHFGSNGSAGFATGYSFPGQSSGRHAYTAHSHVPQQDYKRRYSDSYTPAAHTHNISGMQYLPSTGQSIAAAPSSAGFAPFAPLYQSLPSLTDIQSLPPSNNNLLPLSMSDTVFTPTFDNCMPSATSADPLPSGAGEFSVPVYENEISYNAPFVSADDFNTWLFAPIGNSDQSTLAHDSPADSVNHRDPFDQPTTVRNLINSSDENSVVSTPPTTRRLVTQSIGLFETSISYDKRKELLAVVIDSFHDTLPEVAEARRSVLSGDHDNHPHVLSLPMLQTFLAAFWESVHPQLPILHRPTFAPDTCEHLLLLSMIALGASNLDPSHGVDLHQRSCELGFFLAWHIRFRLFREADFGPPVKLWILRALLLLEMFEKMYSSRSLHERAHVHHSTTITLLRRGSILTGRYNEDFPRDEANFESQHCSGGHVKSTGNHDVDPDWSAWIDLEGTRRIAFAAFLIDTTHAHLFGQSAVMVSHEMRIPLPCDETMWAASSMKDVVTIRNRLATRGYLEVHFLEALKKTLNCKSVKTNTFGRVSIMAGLLSVSWHMKMQDVRASVVGVGKQGNWAQKLMHACDFWKKEFDASLTELASAQPRDTRTLTGNAMTSPMHGLLLRRPFHGELDRDNVFEARTVLYHLVHMVLQCDFMDCMMFAGTTRLLGRVVTAMDRNEASKRMRGTWAPSVRARNATHFAIKFLASVLLPEDSASDEMLPSDYQVCDDVLLNRPWALFIASMIVWSYGYATEGPLVVEQQHYAAQIRAHFDDPAARVKDMRAFLRRMTATVQSPDDLEFATSGRNAVLGLLLFLKESFLNAQWQLLHDAARTLESCVALLVPGAREA